MGHVREHDATDEATERSWPVASLLGAIPLPTLVVGADGRVEAGNAPAVALLGQVDGRSLVDLLAADDAAAAADALDRWRTGTDAAPTMALVATVHAVDGRQPRVLRGGAGPGATVLVILDERPGGPEVSRLTRENHLLHGALAHVNEAVYVVDPDERGILTNPSSGQLTGQADDPPDAVVDAVRARLRTPDGQPLPPEERPLRRALRGEPAEDVELVIDLDGPEQRTFLVTAERVHAPEGDVLGAVAITREVTAERRADAALRASEARLSLLSSVAPVGLFEMDAAGLVVYTNPACREIAGLDGIPGDGWDAIVHPDDRDAVMADWQATLDQGAAGVTTFRARRPDGTVRWVRTRVEPRRDAGGAVSGFVGSLEDITDLLEAMQAATAHAARTEEINRELRASQAAAIQASRAKSEFLSRMSHELRTPLNSVIGFAQLLQLGPLDDEAAEEAVGLILRSGRHLLDLIDEVLDISRIESGSLTMALEPVAVAPLLTDAVDVLRPAAARANVSVRIEEGDGTGRTGTVPGGDRPPVLFVRADRQRLLQVVLNLLSNGLKYNRPGGSVVVRWWTDGGQVHVAVTDTGPGIAAEYRERVFEPFDRLGAEFTGVDGTGIGLSLSLGLVELMGGTLRLTATSDAGTTFTLSLPCADREGCAPGEGDGTGDEGGPARRSVRVLYIEDNPANAMLVQRTLQSRGNVALRCVDCAEAGLAAAVADPPDLILLDLHLPDASGLDVLRALRTDPRTAAVPVTVVTADAMPGMPERLAAAGADGYLAKPLQLTDLLAVVDAVAAKP
jgi:PAS domain S-box-containing protein